MKTILVTGGAGYIGSHTVLQLLEQDYSVVGVVDSVRVDAVSDQHDRWLSSWTLSNSS